MPWKQQSGGPWGGGGGGQGPWGGGGGGRRPSGGGGGQPPDIEELLRQSQERFKRFMPKGGGGGRGFALVILAALLLWLASGFYRVQPGEQGIELLFGEYTALTTPGLNYWFPAPIGEATVLNVDRTNQIPIGFRGDPDLAQDTTLRDVPEESLMLTSDQNIIDIDYVVQWRIKNAANYLFNLRDPEGTVKAAAESAIREVIGKTSLDNALTVQRQEVENKTQDLLQDILDYYGAGVQVADVKQLKVDPPEEVIDAFNDVQRARQDKERSQNEALAYRNDIIPKAQGRGQQIIEQARAYREQIINEAEGEAQRFLSVYETYKTNRNVTTRRLYLERMQQVFGDARDKIIIDQQGGQGVVPYLPLPEIQKRRTTGTGQEAQQ